MKKTQNLQNDFRKIVAAQVMNIDGVFYVQLDSRWIECARGEKLFVFGPSLETVVVDDRLYCYKFEQYQPVELQRFRFNEDNTLLFFDGAIYRREEYGFAETEIEPWLESKHANLLKVMRNDGKVEVVSYDGRAIVFLGELIEEVTPTVAKIKSQGVEMFCQLAPEFQVLDESNRIVRFETSGENNRWIRLFKDGPSSIFARNFCANVYGKYIYLP